MWRHDCHWDLCVVSLHPTRLLVIKHGRDNKTLIIYEVWKWLKFASVPYKNRRVEELRSVSSTLQTEVRSNVMKWRAGQRNDNGAFPFPLEMNWNIAFKMGENLETLMLKNLSNIKQMANGLHPNFTSIAFILWKTVIETQVVWRRRKSRKGDEILWTELRWERHTHTNTRAIPL